MKIGNWKIEYKLILVILCVLSIMFLPDFEITQSLPGIQLVDFILPLIFLSILMDRRVILYNVYFTFLLIFCVYILFTISINYRLGSKTDLFEIYKILKYLLIVVWATTLDVKKHVLPVIKPAFILLVIINLIHFFDYAPLNYLLQHRYGGDLNIEYFGKNTLGEIAGKRMVGTLANPNNNAVIFSFFSIYFFPFKWKKDKLLFWAIAIWMVFLCQSKTTYIFCFGSVIALLIFKLVNWNYKQWIAFLSVSLLMYTISYFMCTQNLQTNTYTSVILNGTVIETNSATGRIETWKFLGSMILDKPLFGHGPNKDFFYDNKIYSENEYVLYAWRYGFVGLVCYLFIYLIPFLQVIRKKTSYYKEFTLMCVLMTCTALTNNPITERNILVLFALGVGIAIASRGVEYEKNKP